MEGFLRKIYEGFDASHEIEPTAWREVLRIMNEASVEGLIRSGHTSHEKTFLSKIRHSNEVFSAFKCHSMGSKMQERLYDEEGKLRPFKEWRESVRSIASHQTGAWLKTEYDTAVLRAHQASDWQEFEQNKDILPNLRWMPTTSPTPENVHEGFWSSKLTLPIDDPFWVQNHPANRWNCKCSLEATDEPSSETTPPPSETPKPQAGLEENPRHGRIFSDKHPYFPKSCSVCPFYSQKKGLKNWIGRLLENRQKDCHHCPYINQAIDKAKIAEGEIYYRVNEKKYGDRFQISIKADDSDLEDNKRVARALLDSFPDMKIKIRPHLRIDNHKNPEFEINGLIGDNKRIEGMGGVKNGFKKAIEQGCNAVVIDLDAKIKHLNIEKLSKAISDRKEDFKSGIIKECYVLFNDKAVCIKTHDRNEIRRTLSHLQEQK